MTDQTRRQLEAELARLEAALPPDVVEIALGDFGVQTFRLPRLLQPAADRLREVARELANA